MTARHALLILAVAGFAHAGELAAQDAAHPDLASAAVRVEVTLPGQPEAIYDAITGDISGWWDHKFSESPARFFIDARPGGHFLEIFDDSGDGVVHATVIYAKRGERLTFDGPLGFSGQAVQIVTTYGFAAMGADSTSLVVEVNAAGTLDEQERSALEAVWRHFILGRFKPYVEERHGSLPAHGT